MANAVIELHDSRVVRVHAIGSDVVLDVDAYVHVSEGEPGVDEGTGWKRTVTVTIRNGSIRRTIENDLLISDGQLRVGEKTFDNMLPLDLDVAGDVSIELVGAEGTLSITGNGISVTPHGEATYVERFRR